MDKTDQMKQLMLDVQSMFESPAGQRLWKHLENVCFANRSTFDKDPQTHAFREGSRSIFLHLQTLKLTDVNEFEQHVKKQKEQEEHG